MSEIADSYNWLIHRIIRRALIDAFETFAEGRLLDIGCGLKPYHVLTAPYVSEHIGVDLATSPHGTSAIDIVASAYQIPMSASSVDTVLCTDVLEHLEDPRRAVQEAARVLRPGGYAIYTVPLFWHLHEEPRDFYRFTPHSLRYLMVAAGLEVIMVRPLTGFVATFMQEFTYFIQPLGRRRLRFLHPIVLIVGHVAQALGLLMNRIDPSRGFTTEYIAVGWKPPE